MPDPSSIPYPMLALDASSRRVCAALIRAPGEAASAHSPEEASQSLYPLISKLLEKQSLSLAHIRSIAFCEGPGSMLGIRTAIMGIRSWQGAQLIGDLPIFSFSSLRAGATALLANTPPAPSFLLLADARRQQWSGLTVANQQPGETITLWENAALANAKLPLIAFEEFPSWTKPPAPLEKQPYRPETAFASPDFATILRPNPASEAAIIRPATFAKWVPKARTSEQIQP